MTRLSQRQASSQWGIARVTLQRAIQSGKVSKGTDGKIDVSELFRVFGEPKGPAQGRESRPEKSTERAAIEEAYRQEAEALKAEKAALLVEKEHLRELLAEARARAEFAEKTVLMLTHEPQKTAWWRRVFGE